MGVQGTDRHLVTFSPWGRLLGICCSRFHHVGFTPPALHTITMPSSSFLADTPYAKRIPPSASSALNTSFVFDSKAAVGWQSIAKMCMFLESLHRCCSIAQFVRRYPGFPPAGDSERRNRRLHGCAKAKGLITFGSINSKLGDDIQFICVSS